MSVPCPTICRLLLAGWVAGWLPHAAASECGYRVEPPAAGTVRLLRVGEVDRPSPAMPASRVVNEGPHDIRISFDGLASRVLQRGQAEPATGRLAAGVRLTAVECLPSRAGAHWLGPPWPPTAPGAAGSARRLAFHPASRGTRS